MLVYLVGGAVRDLLLGNEPKDRDYVVVGATPDKLLDNGFIQVGKKFPVFLHPKTKEEYALARIEKKTGKGYQGFSFRFDTSVSLKQDLMRRDFTINAMAMIEESGEVFDNFGGRKDLKAKVIRHVSSHFNEDPLRVLRALRFSSNLNFSIAKETQELIKKMIQQGELLNLSRDRILLEVKKVEKFKSFISLCREYKILKFLFPSVKDNDSSNFESYVSFRKSDEIFGIYNFTKEFQIVQKVFSSCLINFQERGVTAESVLDMMEKCRRSEERFIKVIYLIRLHNINISVNKSLDCFRSLKELRFDNNQSYDEIFMQKISCIQRCEFLN